MAMTFGKTVVTTFTPPANAVYPIHVRFPEDAWFLLEVIAATFGITVNHLRVVMHRHRKKLGPGVYQRRGTRRWHNDGIYRLVSMKDYKYLRRIFRNKLY